MRSHPLAVRGGPRPLILLAAVLLFGPSLATASLVEDATGGAVAYQFDGTNHHDAPDRCEDAAPAWRLPFGGSTDGMLVPGDDMADVFVLDVPAEAVGSQLVIRLTEKVSGPNAEFTVFAPGCAGSVLEPANHPFPPPRPPAPGPGEKRVTPENPTGPWDCDSTAWVFKVTQLFDEPAPASVHAAWTDGSEETIRLTQEVGVSRYTTTGHTAFTLTNAWLNVPADWQGHFTINRGPCNAQHGGAVYGQPPSATLDRLVFTPIRAGPHEVSVRLANPQLEEVPTSIAVSCHDCLGAPEEAAKQVEYDVSSSKSGSK